MTPLLENFDFGKLSLDDRLLLIGRIWDTIDPQNEAIPVPQWHLELIRERIAADEANPQGRSNWEDFKRELLGE